MGSGALWALRGQSSLTVFSPPFHSRQPSSVYKQITSLRAPEESHPTISKTPITPTPKKKKKGLLTKLQKLHYF